ncbi:SEC-C domain-containing protein, partial [bacterium]|nr:SEC-C domain-containing protein [bacterium]
LQVIDDQWKDHLLSMDELKEGIGLRGYGQKDPLIEYQREATEMFEDMMAEIYKEIFEKVYRVTITQEPETGLSRLSYMKEEGRQSVAQTVASSQSTNRGDGADAAQQRHVTTYRRSQPKIGPNDACPCGSGKKYKKCCGSPAALAQSRHSNMPPVDRE